MVRSKFRIHWHLMHLVRGPLLLGSSYVLANQISPAAKKKTSAAPIGRFRFNIPSTLTAYSTCIVQYPSVEYSILFQFFVFPRLNGTKYCEYSLPRTHYIHYPLAIILTCYYCSSQACLLGGYESYLFVLISIIICQSLLLRRSPLH